MNSEGGFFIHLFNGLCDKKNAIVSVCSFRFECEHLTSHVKRYSRIRLPSEFALPFAAPAPVLVTQIPDGFAA